MDKKANDLKEIMSLVEQIFQVIDRYETSRPGSLGFTKLEEAVLWLQVMVNQVPLKAVEVKEGELQTKQVA